MNKKIQEDFNRLAGLEREGWSHNAHYHAWLMQRVPLVCGDILEIGCGTGAFARLLAARARHVLALDLAPEMVRMARLRSGEHANLEYQVADVLDTTLDANHYDCIVSIATMHHLPLPVMLEKCKAALSPGGVLLIMDLVRAGTLAEFLLNFIAVPADLVMKALRGGWRGITPAERAAWREHAQRDHYLTISEVRRVCAAHLPGAKVRRFLFWRYALTWVKPVKDGM